MFLDDVKARVLSLTQRKQQVEQIAEQSRQESLVLHGAIQECTAIINRLLTDPEFSEKTKTKTKVKKSKKTETQSQETNTSEVSEDTDSTQEELAA